MSDLIFRPYFEEQQQKVASFFATECLDDYFATKLEKMLEKHLQECCDFVNAVARNAVKRNS